MNRKKPASVLSRSYRRRNKIPARAIKLAATKPASPRIVFHTLSGTPVSGTPSPVQNFGDDSSHHESVAFRRARERSKEITESLKKLEYPNDLFSDERYSAGEHSANDLSQ